jgi:hypothetical protein
MKKSTLSLLLALGVFFSLNGFADDKVTCYKLRKNGKLKDSQKKSCNGTSWHDSIEKAVAAAKAKCDQKKQRSGKHEWKETDGKDGKGRCVKTKNLLGKFKYKIGNNQATLISDIKNLCFAKENESSADDNRMLRKVKKTCKKAQKRYRKLVAKACKKEIKKNREAYIDGLDGSFKKLGQKFKNLFKKKKKDGVSCKQVGKDTLADLIKNIEDSGKKLL